MHQPRVRISSRCWDFAPRNCLAASIGGAATGIRWRFRRSRAACLWLPNSGAPARKGSFLKHLAGAPVGGQPITVRGRSASKVVALLPRAQLLSSGGIGFRFLIGGRCGQDQRLGSVQLCPGPGLGRNPSGGAAARSDDLWPAPSPILGSTMQVDRLRPAMRRRCVMDSSASECLP